MWAAPSSNGLLRAAGLLLLALGSVLTTPAATAQPFVLDEIASGLGSVTDVTHAGDGSGRLFIVTQTGQILIHDGAGIQPTPFLDIETRMSCCGERGLLGVAFHPNYTSNGFFFVYYTDLAGDAQLSRFSVSAGDPDLGDDGSEEPIATYLQPFPNHNGGQIQFGPDGYLYVAIGDGGSGGDPGNRAQDLSDPLGKLLRLDVDGALPYEIPPDNPFVGIAGLDEIWAYGLRNPWRFSFDRVTGDLFLADVGQNDWEEIDFQPANSPGCENYGWRLMEGNHCFNPSSGCMPGPPNGCNPTGELTLPAYEYPHSDGNCSVTGGYRYRGSAIPALDAVYLFADYCSGRIWGLRIDPDGSAAGVAELVDTTELITTFGEDERGELYVGTSGGSVFRLTPPLRVSPPSGTYGSTQSFDLLISFYESGLQVVALSLVLDGVEVFSGLPPCAVLGTLPNGGRTLRCELPLGTLSPGTHGLEVTAETAGGETLSDSALWTIEQVAE